MASLGTRRSGQDLDHPTPSKDLNRARQAHGASHRGPRRRRFRGGVVNLVVMALAGGIAATMALPAYAFNPSEQSGTQFASSSAESARLAGAQSVKVAPGVEAAAATRDVYSATSQADLDAAKAAAAQAAAAAAAAAAQKAAEQQMVAYGAAYNGPSAADYLANPPYPNFSLAQVFNVAKQYIGTPYVYGGATPAGFDCSGYVMFVYAQFGINLPHSASAQGAMGTRISLADAQPGDVVIMLGGAHDGFYAGNGNIMDAPDVGRSISIRPIWTSDYYIVRFGI